jgi:hypothetical protein
MIKQVVRQTTELNCVQNKLEISAMRIKKYVRDHVEKKCSYQIL